MSYFSTDSLTPLFQEEWVSFCNQLLSATQIQYDRERRVPGDSGNKEKYEDEGQQDKKEDREEKMRF